MVTGSAKALEPKKGTSTPMARTCWVKIAASMCRAPAKIASGSLSMAAGDIVKQKQIPAVGCSPTNPLVTLNNDYYFRVCFIDPFQGTVMANYAVNELGAKTAAVIQDVTQDYSVGLSKYFRSEEHTSELQSRPHLVCRLLLEKKKHRLKRRR